MGGIRGNYCAHCDRQIARCICGQSTRAPAAPDEQYDILQLWAVSKMERADLEAEVLKLRAERDQQHSGNTLQGNTASAGREALIGQDIVAAERHATLYEGDDRECIKTDVINSFYAGIAYERKRVAAPELDVEAERLLRECKRFMEDMHAMPVEWTIKESQVLHEKVSNALTARTAATGTQAGRAPGCACRSCNPYMVGRMMFICPACGDKRCPNSADHRNGCPSHSPVGAKEQDK